MVKEKILGIIKKIDFSEYLEERVECPDCKKDSLVRHISKEPQQDWCGKWFVEYCEECPYWKSGFLMKKYKPSENYRWIPDVKRKKETTKGRASDE